MASTHSPAELSNDHARPIFVTGATGFIGAALVRAAIDAGHAVDALTRNEAHEGPLRKAGANPILGSLTDKDGPWTEAAASADAVIHLAQPQTFGGRVTKARARGYGIKRLAMDRNLFDALKASRARRIIYVAGTSYYGDCGPALCDETTVTRPMGWGPYLASAIEAVPAEVARGLPVVLAFPGWVYGPGSWFAEYVLAPLHAGKPVYGLTGPSRYTSPVHISDCARALLHLAAAGEPGQRYFIVDDAPVRGERLAELAARALGVEGRARRLPLPLLKLMVGRVISESLAYENRLSNKKLRATGFEFRFKTSDQGVPDVVQEWLSARRQDALS